MLGPRPFSSPELRNIDKFRDGFVAEGGAGADGAAGGPTQPAPPGDPPAGEGSPARAPPTLAELARRLGLGGTPLAT